MAKAIRDKADVMCNLYQSAEDVPDPRDISLAKKNLMVFDDLLLEIKTHVKRIMLEEDTATLIVSILLKIISSSLAKPSVRTRISFLCFHKI